MGEYKPQIFVVKDDYFTYTVSVMLYLFEQKYSVQACLSKYGFKSYCETRER